MIRPMCTHACTRNSSALAGSQRYAQTNKIIKINRLCVSLGSSRNPPDPHLLPDAKPPEYLTEQIIGTESACDPGKCRVRQAQFLGHQFNLAGLSARRVKMAGGLLQRNQMPLPGEQQVIAAPMPAGQ